MEGVIIDRALVWHIEAAEDQTKCDSGAGQWLLKTDDGRYLEESLEGVFVGVGEENKTYGFRLANKKNEAQQCFKIEIDTDGKGGAFGNISEVSQLSQDNMIKISSTT
jgi:hypothetical protein